MTKFYPAHYRKTSKQGFTLVETLLVISIFVMISFAFYAFQRDIFSLNERLSRNLTAQDEARRALKFMISEIRVASPSSVGSYALSQVATSSFTFYANIDNDTLKERVRYFVEDSTLKRGVIKPSGSPPIYNLESEEFIELVHDLVNGTTSVFSYYDEGYDGTTPALSEPVDATLVRLVKIFFAVSGGAQATTTPLTFTTQVQMRNLKDNL